ncbi:MAG: hypothetical protein OXE92_00380 [Bacteroidetes bacterium]|nr:hypothetical protein [Bacteroidota bacterium]MCY4204166.1 hypothetical protein [Bacteroidota bacterium]
MPDNYSLGELEKFISKLIPNGDPVWPRAVSYIDEIPQEDRKFKPHKELRAQIRARLAIRHSPRSLGMAIGAGDLNAG